MLEPDGPQRLLLVTWGGGGNASQLLAIAARLTARGHQVRLLGPESLHADATAAGCAFTATTWEPDGGDCTDADTDFIRDWEAKSPPAAVKRAFDGVLLGPARGQAADVRAALERERFDAVAVDFMMLGALAAAEASGLPVVALMHTVYALPAPGLPPFGMGLKPAHGRAQRLRDAALAKLGPRMWGPYLPVLNAAREDVGLGPVATPFEQLDRADRVLVLTSESFDLKAERLPDNVAYVGPQIPAPSGDQSWDSPWPDDHPDPLVVIGLSTTFQDQADLAQRLLEAVAPLRVRALLTLGPALDGGSLRCPPNAAIRTWVPHTAVLPQADLVVTHGGLGTVMAALAHGVPVVCAPMGRDQADNAVRVAASGAGRRVSSKAKATTLRRAIGETLADPSHREAARRMQAAIERELADDALMEEFDRLLATAR